MSDEEGKSGIDLYTWGTPNGRKASIMLEELGLAYRVFPVDIARDEQRRAAFAAISPNGKIPILVDHDAGGVRLMESAAILMYLARRAGRLMSPSGPAFWEQMQWLMFQVGHIGPMLGQAHHFLQFHPGKSPYAEERYRNETARLYGVLDARLRDREHICGDYSIVDIATWPWISRFEYQRMDLNDFPAVKEWYLRVAARPAVAAGCNVPKPAGIPLPG